MLPTEMRIRDGLSFDDVSLEPRDTDVTPSEVDARTSIGADILLRTPILSSPMDRVTEARMAIAMAREGGLGIIHRNMTPDLQAQEVDKVKRSEHGIITNPISLPPDKTIQDAVNLMERYHISGVPITEPVTGRLVGILTNRDIRFETNFEPPDQRYHDHRPLPQRRTGHRLSGHHAGAGAGDPPGQPHRETPHRGQRPQTARPHHHQGHSESTPVPERDQGRAGPPALRSRHRSAARSRSAVRRRWWRPGWT